MGRKISAGLHGRLEFLGFLHCGCWGAAVGSEVYIYCFWSVCLMQGFVKIEVGRVIFGKRVLEGRDRRLASDLSDMKTSKSLNQLWCFSKFQISPSTNKKQYI